MTGSSVNNRDKNIDVLKTICLVCMILGHCGFPGTQFIYLFHMPLFFMASGYLFNKKTVSTFSGLRNFVIRKIKSLWLPYVIWNGAMVVLQNFFLNISFYTTNPEILAFSGSTTQEYITIRDFAVRFIKILFLKSGTQFTSAFWFVRVLFVAEIAVGVMWFFLQSAKIRENVANILMGILAMIALCVGYVLKIKDIGLMDFSQCFVAVTLFWLGGLMKGRLVSKILEKKRSMLIALVALLILNAQGIILINKNEFTNPFFLIGCSISGWIFVYGISKTLNYCVKIGIWAYNINKAAIDIMALHFIAFKIVSIVQVKIWNLPIYHIARFPVLDGSHGWWIFYCFVGMIVPFAFYSMRIRFKKYIYLNMVKQNE